MKRLTLTFDNGPDPAVTPAVVDALGERAMTATFFIVGSQLRPPGARDIVASTRDAGHRIGNHSMTHTVPLGEIGDPVREVAEIDDAAAALGPLAGRMFRPFGGGGFLGPHLLSAAAVEHLTNGRYTVALWNSVPRDWEDPTGWPDRARREIAGVDWTVLVLHDLATGAMDRLPQFLDSVTSDGVEVVADFPSSCLPIVDGVVQWPIDHLIGSGCTGST